MVFLIKAGSIVANKIQNRAQRTVHLSLVLITNKYFVFLEIITGKRIKKKAIEWQVESIDLCSFQNDWLKKH